MCTMGISSKTLTYGGEIPFKRRKFDVIAGYLKSALNLD